MGWIISYTKKAHMNKTALKRHVITLESTTIKSLLLLGYTKKAAVSIKKNYKNTAKNIRKLLSKI